MNDKKVYMELEKRVMLLEDLLEQSLRIQGEYARELNTLDGGERKSYISIRIWKEDLEKGGRLRC